MSQDSAQKLHLACINNDIGKALQIIKSEDLTNSDINECLFVAVHHGNIEVLSSIIEAPKLDPRIFDLTALLEKSLRLKQLEIATYLVERPGIGEHDLNVVVFSRSWQEHAALSKTTIDKLSLIAKTDQANLWHQTNQGNLNIVKHIVESDNYYDLFPSLSVAATNNDREIVAYLFDKAGSSLRHEQIRKLLLQANDESHQWLENRVLQQKLTENLVEKETTSKPKI